MSVKFKFLFLSAPFLFIGLFFIMPGSASAATNISATSTMHWAWNDIIGWMDYYNTLNVNVNTIGLTGYASSSVGFISLDCATSPNGNICGTSNYQVLNDGNGNLSGWAWNDQVGWISFCGGQSSSSCPGTTGYSVNINASTGIFTGWAWNDTVGWFSFNCTNVVGSCSTSQYDVRTSWFATSTSGYLESTTYDTGASGGAVPNSVMWVGSQPGGSVNIKFAGSNATSGPWSYTTSTNYLVPACSAVTSCTPTKLDYTLNNNRYFRYRIQLTSDQAQRQTPRIDDIIVNWSP